MNFRKVKFEMKRGNGYGQYFVEGIYKGKKIVAYTTDSEAWDWQNSDVKKERDYSRKHCYCKIVQSYNALGI